MVAKKKAARRKTPAKKKAATRKRLTTAERATKLENDRREKFAMAYAANGGVGAAAAREAGYAEPNARKEAYRLLTYVDVKQRVQFYKRQFHDLLMATKQDALQHVAEMAMFDPINMFDEEGKLKPIQEMDAATRKSITEIKLIRPPGEEPNGEMMCEVKYGKDTRAYAEMLMKHYNAYEDHQDAGANKELKIYLMYPEDALA